MRVALILIFLQIGEYQTVLSFSCNNDQSIYKSIRCIRPITVCSMSTTSEPMNSWSLEERQVLSEGLLKMNTVMSPDFFVKSPILKQFYTKLTKAVEIRESSIPGAGLGLFAKKAIKANTIISFYPVHALGTNIDDSFVSSNVEDETYFHTVPPYKSVYLHCTDQPIFGRPSLMTDITIRKYNQFESQPVNAMKQVPPLFLDVNPNRKLCDGWFSHMINDGASLMTTTSNNKIENKSIERSVLEYYQSSKVVKNCIHIPFGPSPILATVTTKKIAKDEELFTMYGGVYWLGVLANDDTANDFIAITSSIQSEINESAKDLFQCMKIVSELYGNQIQALQMEYDKL